MSEKSSVWWAALIATIKYVCVCEVGGRKGREVCVWVGVGLISCVDVCYWMGEMCGWDNLDCCRKMHVHVCVHVGEWKKGKECV